MKSRHSAIALIAAGALLCALSVQCFLFAQAQKEEETRFAQNFYSYFSVFSSRFRSCTQGDMEAMPAETMEARYDELVYAMDYFRSVRPYSVGVLRPSRPFAPNFDDSALRDLQQSFYARAEKLTYGYVLDQADVQWLLTLGGALEQLEATLYSNQGTFQTDFLQEDWFTALFDDFFSRIAE